MTNKREISPLGFGFDCSSDISCKWLKDDLVEGLSFLLTGCGENFDVLVSCPDHLAYRCVDEGDFLITLADMAGLPRVNLYEERNSEFLSWFKMQSLRQKRCDLIRHFIIATGDACIEVLSPKPPCFVRIKK